MSFYGELSTCRPSNKNENWRKKEVMSERASERTLPHFTITAVLSAEKKMKERIRSILSAVRGRLPLYYFNRDVRVSWAARCHINFTFLTPTTSKRMNYFSLVTLHIFFFQTQVTGHIEAHTDNCLFLIAENHENFLDESSNCTPFRSITHC